MLKLLRQLFRHCPPRGLEASDFMNTSPGCTAERQLRVRRGDPSVMLSAFRPPPPTQEIQGGLVPHGVSTGHAGQSPRTFLKASPWTWARRLSSGLEARQQHPHWGLTSAAGLQDACPRALGHGQSREDLRRRQQRVLRQPSKRVNGT